MQTKRGFKSLILLIAITCASFLLCFIGVWAATMKPSTSGSFNPNIICTIEASTDGGESYSNTKVFDNTSGVNATTYMNDDGTLKYSTTITSSTDSVSSLCFKLTNYTTSKNIQLKLTGATVTVNSAATSVMNYITADYANCDNATKSGDNYTSTPSDILNLNMSLPNSGTSAQTVTLQFEVIEVFKISIIGSTVTGSGNNFVSNSNGGAYYCSNDADVALSITTTAGNALPEIVSGADKTTITYSSYNSSTKCKATLNVSASNITNGQVTFKTTELFKIYKNTANEDLLPTNGKTGSDKQVYRYFVEMGEYPQTYVGKSTDSSELITYLNGQYSANNYQTVSQSLVGAKSGGGEQVTATNVYVIEGNDGNSYVRTPVYVSALTNYAYSDNTRITNSVDAYFKIEPIKWIVIGVSSGTLDDLHYSNNMLYTNSVCTTPFTGELTLMCASALDTTQFNSSNGYAQFGNSLVNTFLNTSSSGTFAQLTGVALKDSTSSGLVATYGSTNTTKQNNFIIKETLSTYTATGSTTSSSQDVNANLFLLAGLDGNGSANPTNTQSESYHYTDYFAGAGFEDATYTVGVASPTDYALAHYAIAGQTFENNVRVNASCTRGWTISGGSSDYTATNATTCYWTRSVSSTTQTSTATSMAGMINCNGYARSNAVSGYAITVRPCMVLDMNYYVNQL